MKEAYFSVESFLPSGGVTFAVLQTRLLAFVNAQINNGIYTERGLARVLGISQPQLHNVLKGARKLRPELADLLLKRFGISALRFVTEEEWAREISASRSNSELPGRKPVASDYEPRDNRRTG